MKVVWAIICIASVWVAANAAPAPNAEASPIAEASPNAEPIPFAEPSPSAEPDPQSFNAEVVAASGVPQGNVLTSIQHALPVGHVFSSTSSGSAAPFDLENLVRQITGGGSTITSANFVSGPLNPNFGQPQPVISPFTHVRPRLVVDVNDINRQGNTVNRQGSLGINRQGFLSLGEANSREFFDGGSNEQNVVFHIGNTGGGAPLGGAGGSLGGGGLRLGGAGGSLGGGGLSFGGAGGSLGGGGVSLSSTNANLGGGGIFLGLGGGGVNLGGSSLSSIQPSFVSSSISGGYIPPVSLGTPTNAYTAPQQSAISAPAPAPILGGGLSLGVGGGSLGGGRLSLGGAGGSLGGAGGSLGGGGLSLGGAPASFLVVDSIETLGDISGEQDVVFQIGNTGGGLSLGGAGGSVGGGGLSLGGAGGSLGGGGVSLGSAGGSLGGGGLSLGAKPQLPFKSLGTNTLSTLLSGLTNKIVNPSQTLGSVLRGLNGQDGIIVLDIDREQDDFDDFDTIFDDVDIRGDIDDFGLSSIEDDTILLSGGGSTPLGGPSSLLGVGGSTALGVGLVGASKAAKLPKFLFQGPLSDILLTKGQWFGTLIGGLVDLGESVFRGVSKDKLF